jgi:hypothetical protein
MGPGLVYRGSDATQLMLADDCLVTITNEPAATITELLPRTPFNEHGEATYAPYRCAACPWRRQGCSRLCEPGRVR